MPVAALAGPLIGAGGSIVSGLLGRSSAGSAGKLLGQTGINVAGSLEKATKGAIDAGYAGMAQGRTDLQDYLNQGTTAATGQYDLSNQAILDRLNDANSALFGTTAGANQTLQDYYGKAMAAYSPYLQAGGQGLTQLQQFLAPGGEGTKQFDASMMESQDPGYAFRLQQGQQALERSAAGRGGVLGGAQQKALDRYSQDYASNEYQNAWNRYMQGHQQTYGMLQGLANFGVPAMQGAANAAQGFGGAIAGNTMALGQGTSGNLMTAGGRQAQNYANLGNLLYGGNMSVGQQLANNAMQGNQWIGNIGLQGANLAGNAYMQGALGQASGQLAGGNAMAQGIGGAFNQLGGGMMNNYWNYGSPWGRRKSSPSDFAWQGPVMPQDWGWNYGIDEPGSI